MKVDPRAENEPRRVQLALELLKLGVSNTRVIELLSHDLDVIERQLDFLPYRKCRRPEAFIIEAIRHDYSPPKEFFYAHDQDESTPQSDRLDEDAE